MTSFRDIPITDIEYVLNSNNLNLSSDKYLTVWNFILTHSGIDIPTSIADWIITYNLLQEGINIPKLTTLDIITSKNKLLNLSDERITQVMKYLQKLDDRYLFPNGIKEIVMSDIDKFYVLTNDGKLHKYYIRNNEVYEDLELTSNIPLIKKIRTSEFGLLLSDVNRTILGLSNNLVYPDADFENNNTIIVDYDIAMIDNTLFKLYLNDNG